MRIVITDKGSFRNSKNWLEDLKDYITISKLERFGRLGVEALRNATPKDTGLTANSWDFRIERNENSYKIIWFNTNVVKEYANVAILLQYGHGTRNGGYVEGIDYINPAMKPIFDELADYAMKEVIGLK